MQRYNLTRLTAALFVPIVGTLICSFGAYAACGNCFLSANDCRQKCCPPVRVEPAPDAGEESATAPSVVDPLGDRSDLPSLESRMRARDFGSRRASSLAFADVPSNGGYIDTALVRTQARFRFDAAYGMNRPDRAEFMYTTWRAFGGKNPNPPLGFPDPDIDRQSINLYYEHAFGRGDNYSLFVDLPIIFSDPLYNPNETGIGDMLVGLKVSLHETCSSQLTFQLKNYIPTADAGDKWVGTGHYSIEPGLLYLNRLGNGWTLESEIRDWISVDGAVNPNNGEDYAGNVLRYGVGLGYDLGRIQGRKVTPVVELVGWSVLDGQVFEFDDAAVDPSTPGTGLLGPHDAKTTIVNIKLGARIANACGGSLYAGWGHSLTGSRWYEDIFRLELRKMF